MKLDYSFEMIIFIIGNIHVLTNVYNVYFKNKCLLIYYCIPDYQFIIAIALIRFNAIDDLDEYIFMVRHLLNYVIII